MIGDYLRLALATWLVLLPGRLVARSLGLRSSAAKLAWSFAALFLAWAVVFTVHGTITLALGILVLVGLAALVAGKRSRLVVDLGSVRIRFSERTFRPAFGHGTVFCFGVVLGLLLWHVAGVVTGDGLFHEGRVRKLLDLPHLHLRSVDELAGGGLHPGYAFPLWHGFLALVAKLSGLDPSVVVNHEASLLAPLACVLAWEAGVAVFASAGGGIAVALASVALYCLAAGHGGSYVSLALPATASRQLFVPAVLALFFGFTDSGRRADLATLAVAFGALALIHPTYALFALIPLAAYSVVRRLEWRRSATALAAAIVPSGLVVLWLRPLVDETISHNPDAATQRASLAHYGGELVVDSIHHFRLAAAVPGRTGAVAVAALALVPVAGLAARRRWGAFVLGGTVAVLALMLIPELFVRFSDAVSLSQARRASGFVPFAIAFAGGAAVLARVSRLLVLPLALATGIWLQLAYPGDFGLRTPHNGPGLATWIALVGGAAALAVGILLSLRDRPGREERRGRGELTALLAAALFALPVAVHGFGQWSPRTSRDAYALTPGLVHFLQTSVPKRALVFGDLETSYRVTAFAPVYVVAEPPAHVANTVPNQVHRRRKAVLRFFEHDDDVKIPRGWGAGWLVLRRGEGIDAVKAQGLKPVYADTGYVVFDLRVPRP